MRGVCRRSERFRGGKGRHEGCAMGDSMALKVLKEASEVGIGVLDRWAGDQGAAIVVAIVVRECVCIHTYLYIYTCSPYLS